MKTKNYEIEQYEKRKAERKRRLEELKKSEPDKLDADAILDAYYHNYMDRTILNCWDSIIFLVTKFYKKG